jgi:hypothetical protein
VSSTRRLAILPGLAAAILIASVSGCGGSRGPERYEVSGKVTHGGQPIPAGEVVFEPDPDQGNTGPQSRAPITNGEYRTPPGLGSVPGAVIIEVRGYDGQAHPESPDGLELFRPYQCKAELPREDSEHDLDVPASHE